MSFSVTQVINFLRRLEKSTYVSESFCNDLLMVIKQKPIHLRCSSLFNTHMIHNLMGIAKVSINCEKPDSDIYVVTNQLVDTFKPQRLYINCRYADTPPVDIITIKQQK